MALLAAAHGSGGGYRVTRARWEMGTLLEIDAIGVGRNGTEQAVAAALAAVEEVDRRLSNWKPDSELSLANATASGSPVPLSPATWRSLSLAISVARETGGAFDPTVGVFTGSPTVGWENVILDPGSRSLAFGVAGGAIDSGGFGKGEALDRAIRELERGGVRSARLNFGGQISVLGSKLADVSIAEPVAGSGRELCSFRAPGGGSVSTSGVSEKPGHIVDPRTGSPARFRGSVTVVADTGLRADALSTALFVLGPATGLDFANRHGIAALFVVPRGNRRWDLVRSRRFPPLSSFQD
ncbi:MAG TPA: FAD:protein FMN transferase [Thermoanaerobaculia bacterium]|nr:FAD:protein FMN transferase [Thermoanaerobaculia bacterium]